MAEKPLWRELLADPWIIASLALLLVGTSWFAYEIFFVS